MTKTLKKKMKDHREKKSTPKPPARQPQQKQLKNEKAWAKGTKRSKAKTGLSLNELVKMRGKVSKGTKQYAHIQNQINEALGSKKRHSLAGLPSHGKKAIADRMKTVKKGVARALKGGKKTDKAVKKALDKFPKKKKTKSTRTAGM